MDTNKYFEGILEKLKMLSDEEFGELLLESGIENCPIDETNYYITSSFEQKVYNVVTKKVVYVDTIKTQNKNYVKLVTDTYDGYNMFNNATTKAAS
jgi:hypothetical protein